MERISGLQAVEPFTSFSSTFAIASNCGVVMVCEEPHMATVTFSPGHLYRRTELHKQFGGQRQGGISTPAKAPFVMLITGDSGKQHGYADEWTDDGFFLYTGEGQHGDMKLIKGNRAILDHTNNGKVLHVFEQEKKDKRFLRYLGEME
jgi:5-methylcytosine-specific restriction protein A